MRLKSTYVFLCTDLLEGLKRAQRFRLEDQRGTEINFELPEFLRDSGRSRLRKVIPSPIEENQTGIGQRKSIGKTPQPAPRLSINKRQSSESQNSIENGEFVKDSRLNVSQKSTSSSGSSCDRDALESLYSNAAILTSTSSGSSSPQKPTHNGNDPPPLPPKPKLKYGQSTSQRLTPNGTDKQFIAPRTVYLDQTNSSFV